MHGLRSEGCSFICTLSLWVQNKMMKGFALQLILKHQHLKQRSSSDDETDVLCLAQDDAERELDQLINLKQFLNIVGLEPRTLNVRKSSCPQLDAIKPQV